MEATAVQEEEINVARPSGSIIQIKAISIDLMFPNKTCANFQHNFSIRGYAAEMKAKNPKACNPFSSDGFNDFEEQLPPLHTYQNLGDVQSETPQDSVPLSKDVEKVPDSLNVAASDAEIEIVEAAVNTDTDVRDAEEIADVGDIPVTGNETVSHEGINGDTDNVPVLSEFQKAESSGLLPEEKMNSANDEQIIAETGNPVQNIDEVSVAEPEDSVLEAENMNNVPYDSDWSEEDVPSSNSSCRKVRKVRLLSDLLSEKGSIIKTDPVREYSSTTSSKSLEPTEAETSRSHDRNLHDDVDTDSSGPHTKENFHQEEEISSLRGKLAAKPDAEPTVKRSVIPSSGSGLRIATKADRLKRKIEKNQSLIKKKRKVAQVFDAFPSNKPSKELPKSVNIRNDDSKRCNMSVSRSFGSSSAAGDPTNSSHDYQSARETDKYRNDLSQTPLQIPNLTFNDWSSRKGPFTLDRYQQKIGSSQNPDSVETEIHLKKKKKKKKKNNFRFGEGGIPPTSGEGLLKNKQVLDLNERATHNSSYEFTKGSFPMPKERDFFHHCEQEKLYENQGPSKIVSEQRKHRDGKAVVQGSSDDIPMEIVELMAKNQYERTLGNTGSHLGSFRTFNTMRTFPELQDTRNMERPAAIGYSGLTSFPSPNIRSGMNLPTGSMHYSQMGRNHYNMGQVERSLSIYDAFPQNQRQYSATASVRTGPQHGDVVGPSILSRFGIGSVQNFSVSTPESSHKGKTISDIKADELKKTQEARSFMPEQVGFEFNHKLKGPLDPYANENIPALQLLSLMDERSPGTSFNAGTSRIFDNVQTPGFLNGFLHHNHARENYGLGIGAHNAEECSGQRPFTFSGSLSLESQMQDRSREKVNIFGSASDVSNSGGQTSYRGKDKQKAVAVYSESDDSHMETESGQQNITRLRTLPPHGICSLNRNPADFSVPEAGNEFTIAGKDIKFRKKRKHPSSRPLKSCVHNDGTKQQRKEKTKARKEKGILIINTEE